MSYKFTMVKSKFDNLDLAEIASRKVKRSFTDIKEIKIMYHDARKVSSNNIFESENGFLLEASLLPTGSSDFPSNGVGSYSGSNALISLDSEWLNDSSTGLGGSTVFVKTTHKKSPNVENMLRACGGYEISSYLCE